MKGINRKPLLQVLYSTKYPNDLYLEILLLKRIHEYCLRNCQYSSILAGVNKPVRLVINSTLRKQ